MKRIILIRHGVTECTLLGRFCGRHDPELAPEGHRAAAFTARHPALADAGLIVSSPARRALQTAEMAATHLGMRLRVDPRLHEIDFGAWDGLTPRDLQGRAEYRHWQRDPASCAPAGGEAGLAAQRRLVSAVNDHLSLASKIILVSHKGAIRLIISHFCGLPARDFRKVSPVPASSVSQIELGSRGGETVILGDVSHLPADLVLGAY